MEYQRILRSRGVLQSTSYDGDWGRDEKAGSEKPGSEEARSIWSIFNLLLFYQKWATSACSVPVALDLNFYDGEAYFYSEAQFECQISFVK